MRGQFERAMLFDEATVTTTEQTVEAAAQKALPSHRLRYAVLLVLNVPCLNPLPIHHKKLLAGRSGCSLPLFSSPVIALPSREIRAEMASLSGNLIGKINCQINLPRCRKNAGARTDFTGIDSFPLFDLTKESGWHPLSDNSHFWQRILAKLDFEALTFTLKKR